METHIHTETHEYVTYTVLVEYVLQFSNKFEGRRILISLSCPTNMLAGSDIRNDNV
jgi:septation ring formation regulator EzrA